MEHNYNIGRKNQAIWPGYLPDKYDSECIGKLPFSAKLVGEIYKGNSLLEVIESDPIDITPSDQQDLILYFLPEQEGEYTIESYAAYAGKKTDSKEVRFKVIDNEDKEESWLFQSNFFSIHGLQISNLV